VVDAATEILKAAADEGIDGAERERRARLRALAAALGVLRAAPREL
jgi:hypothetical protein